jgi:acetyltransferase-like isoleucine patch superfamily enzyme
MKFYIKYLNNIGIKLLGIPRFIASDCWFDGLDYSLIEIGHNVVISAYVKVLTHDYSMTRAFIALRFPLETEVYKKSGVVIGDNSFIGLGSIIMPGTRIGKNVIIGSGSVVRGFVPDNSIVIGNPAQVIGDTLEWGKKNINNLENGIYGFDKKAILDDISLRVSLDQE